MIQKVIKAGNSTAVTVPSSFVKTVGVKIGDQVKVDPHPETGKVTYTFKGAHQLLLSNDLVKKS
jgi:antitoxin component of MazEF toxin-antitoxin module